LLRNNSYMGLKPTNSELEVLAVLWQKSPQTVREVYDQIKDNRDIGYTTTLKIMQIMFKKGMLKREKQGKTHIYDVVEPQAQTQSGLVSKMVSTVFHGSSKDLVMQALGSADASKEELNEIRKYLDELEKGKQ
jgi:BlaI family penicillinase repressor